MTKPRPKFKLIKENLSKELSKPDKENLWQQNEFLS